MCVHVQGCQTGLAGRQRGWEELHFSELTFPSLRGRDGRKICPFPGMRVSVFEGLFYMGKSSVARFLSVIEGFPSLRSSVFEGFHCIKKKTT